MFIWYLPSTAPTLSENLARVLLGRSLPTSQQIVEDVEPVMTSRRKTVFQSLNRVTFGHCTKLKPVGFFASGTRITIQEFEFACNGVWSKKNVLPKLLIFEQIVAPGF